jgi:uncharacterized protein YcaQ
MPNLRQLRTQAIAHSLFPPTTLKAAIHRLGFVQADPIRSPARAQDLILRHRVKEYRAGDLEKRYASLDIEEDVFYAYGFLSRPVWQLLHPRDLRKMSALEKKVLDVVQASGALHPGDLERHFGKARVVNAWGGYSKATTHALDHLHYRGLLRIARREKGIRIYEAAPPAAESLPPGQRLRKLMMATLNILAPIAERSLLSGAARFKNLGNVKTILRDLLRSGEIEQQTIEGVTYLWPHSRRSLDRVPEKVRFLAPFDPLVWDRRRFEHLWGWQYRFEAYTPVAKRVRGYYAMPLLWRDGVIGWANARLEGGRLNVDAGFVEKRPDDKEFRSELEAEIDRLGTFLKF